MAALIGLAFLLGLLALVMFPSTTISVVARTHTVQFDTSTQFVAYPQGATTTNTLVYTVTNESFEESTVVPAGGVQRVEEKAMGTVTVYNSYSDNPVKLIKNTRFQTPEGLIFRIPQSVEVPGKKGSQPGSIEVTLFADQSGEQYNVGPIEKLTVPGLKSTPDMYEGVYAKAPKAFSGGFVGDRPAVAPSTLEAARAELRNRLTEKARSLTKTVPEDALAFPGLYHIAFETLPPTNETGGGVRIGEKATVYIPLFAKTQFAQGIGQSVSADAEGQDLSITFAPETAAEPVQPLSQADLGSQPIQFTLSGRGRVEWVLNADELKKALVGRSRDEAAFKTVIAGFPAIETAEARLTPFWRTTFPSDPASIDVEITEIPAL